MKLKKLLLTLFVLAYSLQGSNANASASASASASAAMESVINIPANLAHLPEELPPNCHMVDLDLYRIFCLSEDRVDHPLTETIEKKIKRNCKYSFFKNRFSSTIVYGSCIVAGALCLLPQLIGSTNSNCSLPEVSLINEQPSVPYQELVNYESCLNHHSGQSLTINALGITGGVAFGILGQELYARIIQFQENLNNSYQDGVSDIKEIYRLLAKAILNTYIISHIELHIDSRQAAYFDPRGSEVDPEVTINESQEDVFKDPELSLKIIKKALMRVKDIRYKLNATQGLDKKLVDQIVGPLEQLANLIIKGRPTEEAFMRYITDNNRSVKDLKWMFRIITDEDLKEIIMRIPSFKK